MMKSFSKTLGVLLAATVMLASCLGDDNSETTLYSDTAISGFTLGKLNRYTETTSATTGNDTIIKTTLTGASYPMTIDHLNGEIYNQQPLPVGTDTAHVVCSITTKNSGVVAIKAIDSDEMTWHHSTDSVNFGLPRVFRVFAVDGSGYRDYTVSLNVSEEEGVNFGWKLVKTDAALAGWTDKCLVAFSDSVRMVDKGTVVCGKKGYRINHDGFVEESANLESWEKAGGMAAVNPQLKSLIGASTEKLYAMGLDGSLKSSVNGFEWTANELDEAASLLPDEEIGITCLPYTSVDSTDYVLLTGNSDKDPVNACVWRKLEDYSSKGLTGKWIYMSIDNRETYRLPRQSNRSMASYQGLALSLGNDRKIYVSRDQGNTWRLESAYQLPAALEGTQVVMTTSGDGMLWVLTDAGQLWNGRKI